MFFIYLAVWLILNGRVTVEILILGILISAALYLFACRVMDYSVAKDVRRFRLLPGLLVYAAILLIEIGKANVGVLRLVMSPRYEPEPVLITFDTKLKTDFARSLLANSITLTPGTITVSLQEGRYQVHCLDKEMAEGIDTSVFVRALEKMEAKAELWKQK